MGDKKLYGFTFPAEANYLTSDRIVREEIYKSFRGKNFYNEAKIEFDEMFIDHVIPVSGGGPDNIYNYVPTTCSFNGKKGSKINEESIQRILSIVHMAYAPQIIENVIKRKNKRKNKQKRYWFDDIPNIMENNIPDNIWNFIEYSMGKIRYLRRDYYTFSDFDFNELELTYKKFNEIVDYLLHKQFKLSISETRCCVFSIVTGKSYPMEKQYYDVSVYFSEEIMKMFGIIV